MTAKAMAHWQMTHGIASSSDGSIGPKTRAFFKDCGKGNEGGTEGPSALRALREKIKEFFGSNQDDKNRASVAGSVSTVIGQTITVQTPNGDSRVVLITASTTIKVKNASHSEPTAGTIADITVGKMLMAEGTDNVDGSLTAIVVKVGILPPPSDLVGGVIPGGAMMKKRDGMMGPHEGMMDGDH
jgi:hypothetical protein